jgi:hypothetical protein
MMRIACAALVVLVLVPAAASAEGGTQIRRCSQQSGAGFTGPYTDPGSLVVGPFAWLGAKRRGVDGAYRSTYRWKQPVLVKPGHTVTLKIAARARDLAGVTFGGGDWSFRKTYSVVVFHACPASKAMSQADGKPVTFWSGGIVLRRPAACVPLEIRVDRGPVQRRAIRIGPGARCAP